MNIFIDTRKKMKIEIVRLSKLIPHCFSGDLEIWNPTQTPDSNTMPGDIENNKSPDEIFDEFGRIELLDFSTRSCYKFIIFFSLLISFFFFFFFFSFFFSPCLDNNIKNIQTIFRR